MMPRFLIFRSPLLLLQTLGQKARGCCIAFIFFMLPHFATKAQMATAGFYDQLQAQIAIDSNTMLHIAAVEITGNKKTRRYIIEREMRFKAGDSINVSAIYEKLRLSQELIYNTALFTETTLTPYFVSANSIRVVVGVKEKWYIYPTPQFQLVDRNLNEWLNAYNADLKRVTYGARFAHYNLTGRRDQLRIYLLNGFARNISFIYNAPFSNRALTEGFSIGAGFTQNREIIYKTAVNNLPLRYAVDGFVRNQFNINGTYIRRNGFYRTRQFGIGYQYIDVADSVTKFYNPNYFNNERNHIGFPVLTFRFKYVNTNNINYPLKGKIHSLLFTKKGWGINGGVNMLAMDGDYQKFWDLQKGWYSVFAGHLRIKLPFEQAFINQQAFGYGELYLRGLENYVVDGIASALAQFTLKKKVWAFDIPIPFNNKILNKIPVSIFAKTYGDLGYSHINPPFYTQLNNRMLYSGGFGLDILSLYDVNLSIEYSFNQLGQKGLFLRGKGGF
jgi:outer membrane protein assembly factor BamA